MTGYIVEVSPEIEDVVSKVMPGVRWHVWKPFFVEESDGLIVSWVDRVEKFLIRWGGQSISSRKLKRELQAVNVAPRTWAKIVARFTEGSTTWKLQGQSLIVEPCPFS